MFQRPRQSSQSHHRFRPKLEAFEDRTVPSAPAAPGGAGAAAIVGDPGPGATQVFVTHLTGAGEVPSRETRAQGQAIFKVSKDGTELHYRLIAANIENVIAAHIHVGAPDVNGPVVAFLFGPAAPGGGRFSGVLATGTITSADLVGPLAGMELSDLIAAMQAGNTYVNVHTNDGVAPINTEPGDFPGGEIRGQIRLAGPPSGPGVSLPLFLPPGQEEGRGKK